MKGKIIKSGKSLVSLVLVAMMVISLFSMNVSAANVEKAQAAASQTVDSSSAAKDIDDSSATKDIDDSSAKKDLDDSSANRNLYSSSSLTTTFYLIGENFGGTNKSNHNNPINTPYENSSDKYYIDINVNNGDTFALVKENDTGSQYGPGTNNTAIPKGSNTQTWGWYQDRFWKYTGESGTIRIVIAGNNQTDNPYVWYEDTGSTPDPTPTDTTYYIRGRFITDWNDTTSKYPFTKDTATGYYKYETNKTVAELSNNINSQPPYFFIQDSNHSGKTAEHYGSSGGSGHDLEKNTSGKPLSLVTSSQDDVDHYLRFSDTAATDTKNVVIWFDPTNKKIWYTSDSDPVSTEGYSIKINDQSYSFTYNSNKNKFMATTAITVPDKATEIPFEFSHKADSTSTVYTAGGYWLSGQTTTTKEMSQADASTDKIYVGSPIEANTTATVYFTYDEDAKTLTASTEKSTNRLYVDLVFCGDFNKYLNCTNSEYATKFSVDNYLEAEITSPSGTETVKLNYNTANIFGTRKGIFAGNFPDSVFDATSIKFTLKDKEGTALVSHTTTDAPTKAGEIYTYDSDTNNHCGWDSYNTYMVGSEKRKEATLMQLGIDLSEKGENDSKKGTSTYIFFDNSATKWAQLYLYVWDNASGTTNKLDASKNTKRFEMTKLITNDEDRAYQVEKYGHTVDVSDLWVFDVRDLFDGTADEKETKAKAWLSDRVFASGVDAGILFIDRGPNKTFPQHYAYSVDIGDWTVYTYDPATQANGEEHLKFSTTYKSEYYPCFLANSFIDCTKQGGGDEKKYRAYTDGFYDLLQGHTTNNIRLASVTVYIDMHSTPSSVYMDILSTCHDEFNYADIINRPLQRMGTSTVYTATFNLPFDYTNVKSGLSQYASPMFKFDEISAGADGSLKHYKLSAKAQPSGKCAKDDYGTGEVWLEATDLVLSGTKSKSLVSSSSSSADLVASSSPAKAKDIIASGADVDVIESKANVDLNESGWNTAYLKSDFVKSPWDDAGISMNNSQSGKASVDFNVVPGSKHYFRFGIDNTNVGANYTNEVIDSVGKKAKKDTSDSFEYTAGTSTTKVRVCIDQTGNNGDKTPWVWVEDITPPSVDIYFDNSVTKWNNVDLYYWLTNDADGTYNANGFRGNCCKRVDASPHSDSGLCIFKNIPSNATYIAFVRTDTNMTGYGNLYDKDNKPAVTCLYTYNNNTFKPTGFDKSKVLFTPGTATETINETQYLNGTWSVYIPSYTVTYNANGGDPATQTVKTANGKYVLPSTNPSKTGYTFDGWYTTASGGDKVTNDTSYTATTDTTVYAHWTEITYDITYMDGSTTITGLTPTTRKYTESATLPTVATKQGYSLEGWYNNSGLTDGPVKTVPANTAEDKTFYAKWKANTYTVTLSPNVGQGTVTPSSIECTYGEAYGELPTPEAPGYTFKGWYTAATGGEPVTSATKVTNASNHKLYAHWTPNKYTVTATAGANGSITNSGAKQYDYGTYAKFTATPADGYKVSKWLVNGVEQPTTSDTLNYLVTDAENQTVEVQFVEQDKTVIYVGMVDYCFNSSDGSYVSNPQYQIGSGSYNKLEISQTAESTVYYYIDKSAWKDVPRKFYIQKIELNESDLTDGSNTKITFRNGDDTSISYGSPQVIKDGNYYLIYNYDGNNFISVAPADLLYSFTVEDITGGEVAITGEDYKVDSTSGSTTTSTYYAKATTTLTATATATVAGYNFESWSFSNGITKLSGDGATATFNVTANDSTVSAVFSNVIKLIINSASYVQATYGTETFTDKREFDITENTSGTSYTITFEITDKDNFCFDKFDITGCTDPKIEYEDTSTKQKATVTVTRGTSNIVITPVIRSNVDGVTVTAYDQGGNVFNAFDGKSTKVFSGHIGSSVKLTAPAEVSGYKFVGWYTNDDKKYLLSKNTSYTIEGEAFTESISVRAVYSNEDQYFGILSYSHYTYTLKSQNGTVEEKQDPDKSPIVKTTGGYTGTIQNTGVITKNGINDFTVVYADVDKETMSTFSETLNAESNKSIPTYEFSGWMDNGVTLVAGGSTQTLAFVFGDTSNGTTAPFGEKTIIAVWVDALYDINMIYKYKEYDGKVPMEENYNLEGCGIDAPEIKDIKVSNIGMSTFLANLEEFAKDYAPIVNDVYYDYVFKYDGHIVYETERTITYNAIADYTKTSAQKYSIVKGGNSENFTIAYVKPDKVNTINTDYAYYNWIAKCTSEQAVMEDGSRYFLWYTYTDSGKVEVLLCSNTLNTYSMRLTSSNTVKKIYLLVGEAGTAFNGKTLAEYAFEENITINGNNVTYTNINNQTHMHFRVDVNCPSNYTIEKMGVIFYYAADSTPTPGTADKTLPANFDNTMESGSYKVTEEALKVFANEPGKWVKYSETEAYGYAFDLTANKNVDNQVILDLAADNTNDYYYNYVFVGFVTYSYVNDEGKTVTDTIFTEFYDATIPTEYYKGGQKA